ncbi:MAG: hypothetical protein GY809_32625 [Planctomycetes bacterium]|nr:hypothetical protein [Planctomycetota bacterium]
MKKRLILVFTFVVVGLNVGLAGERTEITGQVHDDQARVVEGAEVAIYELHGDGYYSPRSARLLDEFKKSDVGGHFTFDVVLEPNRDFYVVARKEGLALGWAYVHKTHIFQAKPTNEPLTVILQTPYTLGGRLVDFAGKAVADASVQVFKREYGIVCEPRDWFSVKTDTQGRFEFDNLPVDLMVKFYVHVPQRDIVYIYPPQELTGNAAGGYQVDWEDIELKLPSGATVQGQLVNLDTNQGMEDVDVMLYSSEERGPNWRFRSCRITTGTQGKFEITGVPPGAQLLRLVSPKLDQSVYVGKQVSLIVDPQDKTISANMSVRRGVPLEVIVKDQMTGRALPGLTVFVDDRWVEQQKDVFAHETQTDASGIAHLWVPQGRLKIHVWGTNWDDGKKEAGTPVNIVGLRPPRKEILVVPRLPLVRGKVVDAQGRPQKNVHISVGWGQSVVTDDNGWFEGTQNFLYPSHMVTARDTHDNLVGGNFFYDAKREQRIVLEPGSSIRGRVTDEQGRGIPGAEVNLTWECRRGSGRNGVSGAAHMASVSSDSQGHYQLDTVMPLKGGYSYRMRFMASEFSDTGRVITDRMKPGEDLTLPDMKMVPLDAFISGVVVDRDDQPAAHKPVFIGRALGSSTGNATTTDEQGRFKVKRIPEGPVTVQVDFGQGPDAAYVYAHTGDHVRIKLGQHFKPYIAPTSLVGKTLPDLSSLEIGFDPELLKHRKTLVCFVDYTQQASQSAINYLNKIRYDMEQRNIAIICVQVTPVDQDEFDAWKKNHKIRMPIGVLHGDAWWNDKSKLINLQSPENQLGILSQKWGVRSLPWMILTDENQNIMAIGFEYGRILQLVPEPKRSIRLRNNRR